MTPTLAALTAAQSGSPLGPAIPEPEQPAATPPAEPATQSHAEVQSLTGHREAATDAPQPQAEETSPPPIPSELILGGRPQESAPGDWLANLRAEYKDSMIPGMLMAFGVLVLMYLMMRRLIRRPRPAAAPHETRVQEIHDRAAASVTPVERAMAEAEQLARRLAATLDNKADRMDLLIQEADRKLEELNKAIAAVSRNTPVSTHDRPQRPVRTIDPSLMDRARIEQDRAERQPEPRHEPRLTRETTDETNPIHRRVWALADDGMPPVEIARSLNQPIGQVELILNLRKSG
ncbi:MAG: hypothetical protein D6692_02235 [Planctomycetota bacterium]|nr:MAG: hypothetical protein D6692_02235 [Planctomycetota bacterium]